MKHEHLSLELIDRELSRWEMLRRVWLRCEVFDDDDLETVVCKLYIRLSNVKRVYDKINEMGIRPKGFSMEAVSKIAGDGNNPDTELQICARWLNIRNTKITSKFT